MKSSFHTYILNLKRSGAATEFVEAVAKNAQPLFDRQLPILLSLGQLAYATGSSYRFLVQIVERRKDPYRIFSIRKWRGGFRTICVPEPVLRDVQRWIHEQILCSDYASKRLSSVVTAYTPGSSHLCNASRHLGAPWLVKLDIRRFFESISERQVYYLFRSFGYRALMAFYLARLCTRILPFDMDKRLKRTRGRWRNKPHHKTLYSSVCGHLPQGAPTSPMLANLVCTPLDDSLQNVAKCYQAVYTRYADDLVFSGSLADRNEATALSRVVATTVGEFGFGINSRKTTVATNGSRKIVTGLSVDDQKKVRLPRSYKDRLRQELYYLECFGLDDHCKHIGYKNPLTYLLRLDGRIRYACLIEEQLGKDMRAKFEKIFKDFSLIRDVVLG